MTPRAAMESRGAEEGERKHITALFADIKGSVEMMEGLDPEEARSIVDPALQLMMDAVHRYEGTSRSREGTESSLCSELRSLRKTTCGGL